MLADKYERFLMKEKMKEARHQAKLDDLRRKKELAEIREKNSKSVSNFITSLLSLIVVLGMVAFYIYVFTR